jgi:hypothetical protein
MEGLGKCPMFYPVLLWVLDQVPDNEENRDFYNSLFLFMIYTGQRYVSICEIKISDISRYLFNFKNDKMIVTIIVRVTKGNKSFHQPYNIEGNPDLKNENDCIMNFIYWLNQTLKNYHDLDLEDFTNWPKDKVENKYLWGDADSEYTKPISYKTVYNKNKRYYTKAGIPFGLLGLSSFRSGFYCQAYLNSINHEISTEVLNELTMLIAGWRDLRTQDIYRKKELDAMLTIRGRAKQPTPAQMLGCDEEFKSDW